MTRLTEKDLEDIELLQNQAVKHPIEGGPTVSGLVTFTVPKLISEVRRLKTEMNRLAHIAREAAQ